MKRCKRLLAILMIFCLFFSVIPATAQEEVITVTVDGEKVLFDQSPIIENERTLVPLRAIFQALGADVEWIEETQTVIAHKRFDVVSLSIGQNVMNVNGENITIDVPAKVVNNRTLIPVRAVSQAFDLLVMWDGDTKTVTIETEPNVYKITDHYLKEQIRNEKNGDLLLNVICAYPQINNSGINPVISALNKTLLENAQSYINAAKAQGAYMAGEAYIQAKADKKEFAPFQYERYFDVTYNERGIFTVLEAMIETARLDTSPKQTVTANTYDLSTGENINVTKLMTITEEELHKKVIDLFKSDLSITKGYVKDAEEILNSDNFSFVSVPTDFGLIFFAQSNTLAHAAAGFPFVMIQYKDEPNLFKMDYTTVPSNEACIYQLMKMVGEAKGWKKSKLSFTKGDTIDLDGIFCYRWTVTETNEACEVVSTQFAVSPDLVYVYEYNAIENKYRLL